jgi:hypothetical protein
MEKRKIERVRAEGRVVLRNSALTGSLFDVCERGIGVRLLGSPREPVSKRENIHITPEGVSVGAIDLEAEIKWFNEGPQSTILGYEIKSFRDDRQKARFKKLSDARSGREKRNPNIPE